MSRDAAELVSALVERDSTNPQLVPGGAGEGPVAEYLAQRLAAAGLELDLWDVLPGRPNVVATLRGDPAGRTLMLCGHTDVVRGSDAQFRPELRDGRLYGRGAVDMKGGIAAAVLAAERLARQGTLPGDLIIALVIDEEWLSAGAEALVGRHDADAAIFPEPSNLDVVIEHGGFAWFEVESTGFEAAGGDTDLGPRRDRDARPGARGHPDARPRARHAARPGLGPREHPRVDDRGRRPAAGLPLELHRRGRALPDPRRDLARRGGRDPRAARRGAGRRSRAARPASRPSSDVIRSRSGATSRSPRR